MKTNRCYANTHSLIINIKDIIQTCLSRLEINVWWLFCDILPLMTSTVDSRYLEVEGTLKNSSRYPYFDIIRFVVLREKNLNNQFYKRLCNLTPLIKNIY